MGDMRGRKRDVDGSAKSRCLKVKVRFASFVCRIRQGNYLRHDHVKTRNICSEAHVAGKYGNA